MLSRRITQLVAKFSEPRNFAILARSEKEEYLRKLEENADLTYKVYPSLPHQDPNSPEYIPSEFDEYHEKTEVNAYNQIIDNFKHDLQMQRQVWEAINNLDRPYKRGIPGIDTNLYPEGPVKPKLEDLGFPRHDPVNDLTLTFKNEDRFISNTPFHSLLKFKHIKEWEEERKNRPVTRHFNPKGYKYDVEVRPEDKFEYVADRLGHPEFVGTPFEWLFRLENDLYHPCYLDQPFVKLPSAKPHQSLNFEQGEVLYENTKVMEWIKFWQLTTLTAGAFGTIFVPYNLAFKTNLVTDAADELLFCQQHLVTPGIIDITRLSIPVAVGSIFYVVFIVQNFSNFVLSEYVVKMSYSKDQVHQHLFRNFSLSRE